MSDPAQRTVLAPVPAEHDTTLHEAVALFERGGYTFQMASGEDNVATRIGSLKPALIACRLTDPATRRSVCRTSLRAVAMLRPSPRRKTVPRVRRLGVTESTVKPADPPTIIRTIAACL